MLNSHEKNRSNSSTVKALDVLGKDNESTAVAGSLASHKQLLFNQIFPFNVIVTIFKKEKKTCCI
jgi:hypothetical protein